METKLHDSFGYLCVVANTIGKITVKVFDTKGKVARKVCKEIMSGVQNLDLNISDLSNGTYILNAFNGDTFLKSFKIEKK